MESTTNRRSPVVRFFSRSSNAFITAAATLIAAVISVYGVREVERGRADERVSQIEKQLESSRKQLHDANQQIAALRSPTDATGTMTSGPEGANGTDDVYAGQPVATVEQQGFEIRLYRCRREGGAAKCYFDVTNKRAERSLEIAGYPGDNRYSRAYDDQGQLHTSNIPEILGVSGTGVSIPEDVTLRTALTFQTVPSKVKQFKVLKLVFHHAYNSYYADFKNVTIF